MTTPSPAAIRGRCHAAGRFVHHVGIRAAHGDALELRDQRRRDDGAVGLRHDLPESVPAHGGDGGGLELIGGALVELLDAGEGVAVGVQLSGEDPPGAVHDVRLGPHHALRGAARVVDLEALVLPACLVQHHGRRARRQGQRGHLRQRLGLLRGDQAAGELRIVAPDQGAVGQVIGALLLCAIVSVLHLRQVGDGEDGVGGHLQRLDVGRGRILAARDRGDAGARSRQHAYAECAQQQAAARDERLPAVADGRPWGAAAGGGAAGDPDAAQARRAGERGGGGGAYVGAGIAARATGRGALGAHLRALRGACRLGARLAGRPGCGSCARGRAFRRPMCGNAATGGTRACGGAAQGAGRLRGSSARAGCSGGLAACAALWCPLGCHGGNYVISPTGARGFDLTCYNKPKHPSPARPRKGDVRAR